jgi:hypothetical protein
MKRKALIILVLISLLTSGCTLDTSGTGPSREVWIDAPIDGTNLTMGYAAAIMAHTNYQVDRILLLIDGTPFVELNVIQISEGLWEGTGMWTPVSTGRFDLRVRAVSDGSQKDSSKSRVNVLETHSFPMEYVTPTPTATTTQTQTMTPWPPTEVNFWADSLSIVSGDCTLLHWQVSYATGVYLNGEFVAQVGDRQVCPQTTSLYSLNIEAPAGNLEQQLNIIVTPRSLPPTPTHHPTVTPKPPTITVPPDTSGPSLSDVAHSPEFIFDGTTCGATSAQITAKANDLSGISKVELYYRVVKGPTQGAWRMVVMSHSGGKKYQASLGAAELKTSLTNYSGGVVEYYVRAWDNPGNTSQNSTQSFEVKVCLI